MNLQLTFHSLRQLTRRAWNWLWCSLGLLGEAQRVEGAVRNPTPSTEALLLSETAVSDAEWLAELERRIATELAAPDKVLSEHARQTLLDWRRHGRAQFERGDWFREVAALVQPGTTVCANIREHGIAPRNHSLLIRPVVPARRPSSLE